jgi:hypothetical protein
MKKLAHELNREFSRKRYKRPVNNMKFSNSLVIKEVQNNT